MARERTELLSLTDRDTEESSVPRGSDKPFHEVKILGPQSTNAHH